MSFLNPAFLYGLFALAIPLIIHLFHFRKARKIFFSNTRFLQSVKKVSQAKLQLKHLLVLAARMLFIVFLVLTFAQPYIPSATGGGQAQLVDIYVDNSYSMSNKVDEEARGLDAGIQLANEILEAYPTGTRFRLLTNTFNTASQYYASKSAISDRLTETSYSPVSRSFQHVLERLKVLPNELQYRERDVFLVSDFQENTWSGSRPDQITDSLEQFYLLPLTYSQNKNIYVDSVYLEEPVLFTSSQNVIYAILVNTGQQAVEEMPVSLSVNGVQVSNTLVNIPAEGQETIRFQLNFPLQPSNKGVIRFDDYPVTFDNTFYFVIRQAGKVRVLEIKDQPEVSPVAKVYSDSSYFRFRSFQADNLDYGALNEADLVVMNGLSVLDENLQSALLNYQQEGGSLLLIPGEEGFPASASYLVENLTFQPVSVQNPVRLAPIEENNPFFEDVFEEEQSSFDMPRARAVVRWRNTEKILELQTGNPFLSLSQETYLLASPLQEDFTNFHQHALFVPVMYKIAFSSLEMDNSLYHSTNENIFTLQADQLEADKVYKLRQDEQTFIPNQRLNGRSLQLELPSYTLEPGFYELLADEEVLYLVAFNHSQLESQLDQLETEQLAELTEHNDRIELIEGLQANTSRAELGEKFKGEALWKWALLLALLSLLAEVLLIRFWK